MTPLDAEEIAASWMQRMGALSARVTSYTQDGGIDVLSARYVAQVKHQTAAVGAPPVRQLFGVAVSLDRGALFFSRSGFTRAAIQFADATNVALLAYNEMSGDVAPRSIAARDVLGHGLLD
jgi:HJR/Mrr/RecB family endonuclease